ncbi:MAG: sulfatase-like hydrolase/transferase, partial [Verrucomicrobiota bacterium]
MRFDNIAVKAVFAAGLVANWGLTHSIAEETTPAPNVLYTGYLAGHPQAKTPNLDRLAASGIQFNQAYCNSPSCNPSRASIMLGKHPNSTGFYSNPGPAELKPKTGKKSVDLRKYYPNKVTLPQFFNQHGYSTFRTGKIFHYWGDWADMNVAQNDLSFEVHGWGGGKPLKPQTYLSGIDFGSTFKKAGKLTYMDWGAMDEPHERFGEYGRATATIKEIQRDHDRPFFAALGFYLPHLPWYYPQSLCATLIASA